MTAFVIPTRLLPRRVQLVLRLYADGMNDAEIATKIGMRRSAFGTETRRILTSLGAESRAQAVAWAYQEGWLERIPSPRRGRPLAPRDTEAVQLLVDGVTEAEACAVMGLAARGLRAHYTHASSHMSARSRPHLVRLCVDTGIAEIRRQP